MGTARASVLVDLSVSDASGGLLSTSSAASKASASLARAETQARKTDRAMDSLGTRSGELGGRIASLGGMFSLPGFERAAPVVSGIGDSIELMSSPLGAVIGLTAGWGVALGGSIAGAVALVAASDDLIERLDLIGRSDVITPDQIAQLAAARGAITSVGDAWAEVGLILAAEFGPAIQAGAELAIGATLKVAEAVEWLAGKADILSVVLNVLTGGALGQAQMALDALGIEIGGPGGLVDSLREEGKAYAETATQARESAKATEAAAKAHTAAGRAIRDAADIRFGSGASGFSSSDVLPPSMRADLAAFGAGASFLASGLASLATPAEQAAVAFEAQLQAIHEAVQATGDLTSGMILLGAAVDARALAEKAARLAAFEGTLGGLSDLAAGNIGGALSTLGPGGMIASTLIELGPDSAQMLDDRLSQIGENIVKLPETLGKILATFIGFGADSKGEGIGRALGLAAGIGLAIALPGVGLLPGAAIAAGGSAVGGAIGGGAARTDNRRERRDRRDGPRFTINGIVTGEAVARLDREARLQGGPRGRRWQLDRE